MIQRLRALIRNEFRMEFTSPIALVFFLVLPLLFTAAVGAGLGGMMPGDEETPQELRIPLYVRAADQGPLVEAFLAALSETNLEPERVEALPEEGYGLEIPAYFTAALLNGDTVTLTLHTRPDDSTSLAVEQAVRAAQGRVGGAALVAQQGLEQARAAGVVDTPAAETAFFRQVLEDTLAAVQQPPAVAAVRWPAGVTLADDANAMASSAEQASAGQLVTWVQITLLGAAEVLVNERLGGTLRRMLVTPTSRGVVLMGKLLGRLLLGLLQMAILLVGGAVLFGVNWGRDPLAVALVSFAFALAMVSLGILLATVVKTRGQANSVVVGLSMGMAALGGAWYPMEITPPLYRQVVQILPSTWAMRAYTDLLARGADVERVLPYVGVLLGFALVFALVGTLRFQHYE
ncbi:MAG TPA: ABC transporter permease [Anaerolineae bacterium]|nr:ABC transporter permease [Anaerolineae bacterium]HQM13746.1 ABC transporter permease [Anaerolineae bacterium]